ncbi:MAG: sensor histidine kinase [Steroidobacteraceae bacterium]
MTPSGTNGPAGTNDRSASGKSAQRIPPIAFYSLVTAFWIYASFTRIGQWELMRQALPKWRVPALDVQILECTLLFPLLLVLCTVSHRIGLDFREWRRIVPWHVVLALSFGLSSRFAMILAHSMLNETSFLSSVDRYDGDNPWVFGRLYVSQALDEGFQYLVLLCILGGYSFYLRYRDEQSRRETLTLQYERARLQALRMRINPHFLYNTLSAIGGLVGRDPAGAKLMVAGLGELFRRTLIERDAEYIRLGEELELGEQYLRIQKIRFSDRLSYELHARPELHAVEVPPLLLQPLLENAVAHGIGSSEGRVRVKVSCELQGDLVRVSVHNASEGRSFAPFSPGAAGTGLGLESTRERMTAAFGEAASVGTSAPSPGEFLVELVFLPKKPVVMRAPLAAVS